MFPFVVADIGATHARFGLVVGENPVGGKYQITEQQVLICADYVTFGEAMEAYFSSLKDYSPSHVCVAVAAPLEGDDVQLTNLNWCFSINETRKKFELEHLEVINDFAAQACSLTHLQPDDMIVIKAGVPNVKAPKAILGPGTGIGVAGLVPVAEGWQPIAGEGGHVTFAPANEQEIEILKVIWRKKPYVSLESLLCGPGLVELYLALAEVNRQTATLCEPHEITQHALSNNDKLAREAVVLFCSMLGGAAGNLALTLGAKGGVYLAGGILPRIRQLLKESDFVARFIDKGRVSTYMDSIPVYLITHPQPALIGAAAWLEGKFDE